MHTILPLMREVAVEVMLEVWVDVPVLDTVLVIDTVSVLVKVLDALVVADDDAELVLEEV